MAVKKSKKEIKVAETNKESDEEFLKRFAKIREESSKKASEELSSYSKSKEVEELRAKGRQAGKDLEEIEECKKIVEEFKVSPPIIKSVHVNDISTEYSYEDSNVAKKIELLRKHNFPFLSATKNTSIFTVNFKAFGRAYVKRGMQKLPLPESSIPPCTGEGMGTRLVNPKDVVFIVKDGDILGTESGGYIYDVKDAKEDSDNHTNDIFIFPESELRISIRTDTTHPEPAFMEPDKVPEVIKRLSSSTVHTDELMGMELIKGLFQIGFLRKGKDVNKLIALPSEYPHIEFKSRSEMGINMLEETIAKAKKFNPKMAELLAAQILKSITETRAVTGGICNEMSAFIELNRDGSLVLFNTANVIVHKDIGKEAKKILLKTANIDLHKDISEGGWPIKKIIVTRNALYETDCSKIPDPRIATAMKAWMGLRGYVALLSAKKELDDNKSKKIDLAEMDKKMREDDQQMLKTAEDLGDEEIITFMKAEIKGHEEYIRDVRPKQMAEAEIEMRKAKEYGEKNIELYKKQVEAGLPSYNSPNENDKV